MSTVPNTPLTRRALEIATQAHAGQFRRDGKPYITHPIAVAEIAMSLLDEGPTSMQTIEWRELITVLALYHDLGEDVEGLTEQALSAQLQDEGLVTLDQAAVLIRDLHLLNKRHSATYTDYIVSAKGGLLARNEAVRLVKRSDLMHNLSDLPPGSQRDKYELALYILEA